MSIRRPRSYWKKLVAEVERDGSVARVAQRHRVVRATLSWWRWELGRERLPTKKSQPRLLPVVVDSSATPVGTAIEIALGEVTLRLPAGTETGYVTALVKALGQC